VLIISRPCRLLFCLCDAGSGYDDLVHYTHERRRGRGGVYEARTISKAALQLPGEYQIVADEQEQAGSVLKRLRPYMHLSKAKAQRGDSGGEGLLQAKLSSGVRPAGLDCAEWLLFYTVYAGMLSTFVGVFGHSWGERN
jgi:hypothetical protein